MKILKVKFIMIYIIHKIQVALKITKISERFLRRDYYQRVRVGSF